MELSLLNDPISLVRTIRLCSKANSRKRKPRGKKNKNVKPAKVDEVVNSMSSAPPSDKSSEEEEDKEEERVC